MEALQELLNSVAADLDPNISYKEKLFSGGYRTPNAIKQADNAEQIERACGLLLGDANNIWKAAGGGAGRPNIHSNQALPLSMRCSNCKCSLLYTELGHPAKYCLCIHVISGYCQLGRHLKNQALCLQVCKKNPLNSLSAHFSIATA